jgi:hypothetical protein
MQLWFYERVSHLEQRVFLRLLLDYMTTPERERIGGEIVDFVDGDCLYKPIEMAEDLGEKRTNVLTAIQRLEEKGLISQRRKLQDKEGRWTCFIVDWEILFSKKGMWGWMRAAGGKMENVPEPKWAAQLAEEARSKKSRSEDEGDQAGPPSGSPSGGGSPPGGPAPGDDDGPHGPEERRTGARKAAAAALADGNNREIIETSDPLPWACCLICEV